MPSPKPFLCLPSLISFWCPTQASRSDLETVEVRQAWALLRLGPCVEVYSEGDLLGGARTSVGQTPFKVGYRIF